MEWVSARCLCPVPNCIRHSVLVRFDHVASVIINANYSIMMNWAHAQHPSRKSSIVRMSNANAIAIAHSNDARRQ
jgi:hypothetical protein